MRTVTLLVRKDLRIPQGINPNGNIGGETAKFLPECKAKFGRLLDPGW